MSELNEALGGKRLFVHNGKDYHVSLITQNIKAQWEQYLFNKCKEGSKLLKDMMTPQEWAQQLKDLTSDYVAGHFAWEGRFSQETLSSIQGMTQLCAYLFDISYDDMQVLVLQSKEEIAQFLQIIIHDSFPNAKL